MVAATGERMLGLTARFADAWACEWTANSAQLAPLLERVDAACRAVGRDPATLERVAGVYLDLPGAGVPGRDVMADHRAHVGPARVTAEELAELLGDYARAGIGHVVVWLDPGTVEGIEAFAPVLDLLRRGYRGSRLPGS
jgi:alkanesulfonate monooxygenase SsuD/methylene tetrahydromethanopterin reductase-like flavin-dependent oxidoreductase (luciferase family)